jgi:hypothetical protein
MTVHRLRLLALAAVLLLAAFAAPRPAHATFVCHPDIEWDMWWYYSDATYTKRVGICNDDCGDCWCEGQQTIYVKVHSSPIC